MHLPQAAVFGQPCPSTAEWASECLFMNTNHTSVSLSLNVSLLFPASPHLLVKSGALRCDFMSWISTGTLSTQPYWLNACMSSSVIGGYAIQTEKHNQWLTELDPSGSRNCKNTQVPIQNIPRCLGFYSTSGRVSETTENCPTTVMPAAVTISHVTPALQVCWDPQGQFVQFNCFTALAYDW